MPSNRRVIVHIGAGKCGSSALQRSLSLKPLLKGPQGRNLEYIVIDNSGGLVRGQAIVNAAKASVYGYLSSTDLRNDTSTDLVIDGIRRLADIAPNVVPVVSCEGWIAKSELFRDRSIFLEAGLAAEVVIYVRPQLDWLNSGWWQWGAWSGHALERWLNANIENVKWDRAIGVWTDMPGVSKVHVRLATGDVPADFGMLFDVELSSSGRVNVSGDGLLLRALQRFRAFRSHEHDPFFEFAFAKWAPGPRRKTPWVIPHAEGERILEKLRPSNSALMELTGPQIAEQMQNDPRWWSIKPYLEKDVEPVMIDGLSIKDYEELLTRAFYALVNHVRKQPPSDR